MLQKVIRPTTAFLIIGAAVCINCAEITANEEEAQSRPSSPLNETGLEEVRASSPELKDLRFRPPSPTTSIQDKSVNYEAESEQKECGNAMSSMKNSLSGIFTNRQDEQVDNFDSFNEFYGYECYDHGHDHVESEDDEHNESLDSLAKTRGGSKSEFVDVVRGQQEEVSDHEEYVRVRSESPFTRRSRVNSVDSEAGSIIKAKLPGITPEQLAQFDKIADMAGPTLKIHTEKAGLLILGHLVESSKQINFPLVEDSISQDFMIFEQLSEIFLRISEGEPFEYEDLILKCLEITLQVESEYIHFRLIRDSVIVLMFNNLFLFEDYLADPNVFILLRETVKMAGSYGHLDTLDFIRQLLGFSNLCALEEHFKISMRIPKRKPSDEVYLPLKEVNLIRVTSESKQTAKSNTTTTVNRNAVRNISTFNQLFWEHCKMLFTSILIFIIAQYLFFQK